MEIKGKAGNNAFTLIELVMVILLIGILAAVVLPKFVNLTGSANKAASQGVIGSLGEGLTSQFSKDLVNNDLSTYVTFTTAPTTTSAGTVSFVNNANFKAGASGSNPYVDPFLLLPNYSISTSANNGTSAGTIYNFGKAVSPGTGNSWWMYYNVLTASGLGTAAGVTITLACDNTTSNNSNFLAPIITVPINDYIIQIGNVDYIYSNGTTMDSYAYYMEYSDNGNINGFYLVPCQS